MWGRHSKHGFVVRFPHVLDHWRTLDSVKKALAKLKALKGRIKPAKLMEADPLSDALLKIKKARCHAALQLVQTWNVALPMGIVKTLSKFLL